MASRFRHPFTRRWFRFRAPNQSPTHGIGVVLGVAVFLTGALAYTSFAIAREPLPPAPPKAANVPAEGTDDRIVAAFGPNCAELERRFCLDLRSKGLLICARNCEILPDGRVKLTPFSAAVFRKALPDDTQIEIDTMRSDFAVLTFDPPVKSVSEMARSNIIDIELRGPNALTIIRNR